MNISIGKLISGDAFLRFGKNGKDLSIEYSENDFDIVLKNFINVCIYYINTDEMDLWHQHKKISFSIESHINTETVRSYYLNFVRFMDVMELTVEYEDFSFGGFSGPFKTVVNQRIDLVKFTEFIMQEVKKRQSLKDSKYEKFFETMTKYLSKKKGE